MRPPERPDDKQATGETLEQLEAEIEALREEQEADAEMERRENQLIREWEEDGRLD